MCVQLQKNNREEVLEESQRAAPSPPSPRGPWPRVRACVKNSPAGVGRGSLQGAQARPPRIYYLTSSCRSVLRPPPLYRTRRFRASDLPGVPQPRGR